jgi:hypothetical protein
MQESAIIAGLTAKRAELDVALRRLETQAAAIRADRATLDAAIRVFDPARKPPRVKAAREGRTSRLILGALRDAQAPMTVRAIAERIAGQRGVSPADRAAMEALVHNVRNTTARHAGKALVREERDGVVYWRVG